MIRDLLLPDRSSSFKIAALGWPIVIHGLYDAPLMILNNIRHAGSGVQAHSHAGLFLLFASVLLAEIFWAIHLALRLRSEQLKAPKARHGAQRLWTWLWIIVGGMLTTFAVMMALYLIGELPENGGSLLGKAMIVLLTVAVPGFCGVLLFQGGLRGKRTLDMHSGT